MSINLRPLNQNDDNYSKVIDLYKKAFTTAHRIPTWILKFKLRKGKVGFNVLYADDTWIGLIYTTEFKDIVLVHFLAISESFRSGGYGGKVMDSMKVMHSGKRIVLNIEKLDKQEKNFEQRIKRKAFYEKNGFSSSGYFVKEPGEKLEMLIFGGSINKEEIEAMYKNLFGSIIGFLLRPKIINT
ncbi:GNAT family N-acetyltransferase [Colwellia sp. MB3u-70]|uniref:GNAT family N-acetyltransferase n=1 Tax=unclassified Colwellia TaxID=196834 RepID=UPI0015F70B63|nr:MULTISPECIES: GNAT family N-acetyltransferase [unclassified Colwellia]MBA6294395.1 GNAT family N-acetyltransferase [Colwellia sp. MB3u-8]MBA6306111.1 GNAT family N-acetyltransferase [Colwellia sp. MB3u-70]